MKTAKRVSIITAVALIIIGLIIVFLGVALTDFDLGKLNTAKGITNTYTFSDSFERISLNTAECDVRILPSEDSECRVICLEEDKIYHTVAVKNGTLTVERKDTRKWYENIGIYWVDMELTVYLPQDEYQQLDVKSLSGNIQVSDKLTFSSVQINNTSGDVSVLAAVNENLYVKTVSGELYIKQANAKAVTAKTTSGDIKILSVNAENEDSVYVKSVSGDIELEDINANDIEIATTSGEIELSRVAANSSMSIKSVSGDIELSESDASELLIKTTSGDVSGTLLTEKVFLVDTQSGIINVPHSTSGGRCEIKTTSGDIEISVT